MLTHTVFFWAKDDLTSEQLKDFEAGLRTLLDIPLVGEGRLGIAAATNRKVVDRSYTFALSLRFKDMAAHDAYQATTNQLTGEGWDAEEALTVTRMFGQVVKDWLARGQTDLDHLREDLRKHYDEWRS